MRLAVGEAKRVAYEWEERILTNPNIDEKTKQELLTKARTLLCSCRTERGITKAIYYLEAYIYSKTGIWV